jgi:TRAP transporter TAXI family solute receptor
MGKGDKPLGPGAQGMPIRIGTGERGGTFFTQGMALKAAFERDPQAAPLEVLESPGGVSIENANRLDAGNIEFGFISAPWVAAALQGAPPFAHPIDLRIAAPMNVGPNFFVVRADSRLRKVADLRGKKVAVGNSGGGMVQHAEAIFAALGIGPDDLERVYVNFAQGADMLATAKVDAQFQCPIPNRVMIELSERIAVRVLSYDSQHIDAALKSIPLDRPVAMRKGAFRGVDEDTAQLGVLNLLVTHARVEADTVRAVVSAIVRVAGELGQFNPLFADFTELLETVRNRTAAMLGFGGIELHPGAVRAYSEAGFLK